MAYIYQIERVELAEGVGKLGHHIFGDVLDVGSSDQSRYRGYFNCTSYSRMDINPNVGADIVGTADNIPAGNNSFDAIVCTQVLGDVYDTDKVISEFSRILRVD